jgi:hypothetical protein
MDDRIAEYQKKLHELHTCGGHMMDYIGLEKEYADVIAFLKKNDVQYK